VNRVSGPRIPSSLDGWFAVLAVLIVALAAVVAS
jgi:hypothetical protein